MPSAAAGGVAMASMGLMNAPRRDPCHHGPARKAAMMRRLVLLQDLHRASDWAVLALRLFVGAFLVWGVWDNITSSARMDEFAKFLRHHGFAAPALMARLSVWAQFAC